MPGINRFGNTKNVVKSQVKNLVAFPALSAGGKDRVFTRHLSNLALWLPEDALALFMFLIYRAESDNIIKYTTKTLNQYSAAVKMAGDKYKKKKINASVPETRKLFKYLIENSLLLPTEDVKVFLVNPNLTYSKERIGSKFYDSWCMVYRNAKIEELKELTLLFLTYTKNERN